LDGVNIVAENQRQLRNLVDLMSSGKDQRKNGSGRNSRSKSVSLESEVDLSVPSSVGLEWEGHSTLSTHVGEGSLSVSGGTRSLDSWDSGNSSSGSPRLSGVLHTSVSVNSMGLSGVSGDVVVDVLDDVLSEWLGEDIWKFHFLDNGLFGFAIVN
jgi:hypothetical protein